MKELMAGRISEVLALHPEFSVIISGLGEFVVIEEDYYNKCFSLMTEESYYYNRDLNLTYYTQDTSPVAVR